MKRQEQRKTETDSRIQRPLRTNAAVFLHLTGYNVQPAPNPLPLPSKKYIVGSERKMRDQSERNGREHENYTAEDQ